MKYKIKPGTKIFVTNAGYNSQININMYGTVIQPNKSNFLLTKQYAAKYNKPVESTIHFHSDSGGKYWTIKENVSIIPQ